MIPKRGAKPRTGCPVCSKMTKRKITEEEFLKFNDKGSNIKTFILEFAEIIPKENVPEDWYELDIKSKYSFNDKLMYYYRHLDEISFEVDILKDDVISVGRKLANERAKELKIQAEFCILSTVKDEYSYNIIIKSSLITKDYK